MPDLICSHLAKRYRDIVAVDDLSLEVADGEFLVLLGASGSGKTTVLRMLAGIETPDSGEITLGGTRVDQLLSRDRDVAMVFQSYALYAHMSVRNNLAFPLRCAHLPRVEIAARVAEVAEMLSISHLLGRRPGQLSGGQQQRVALGRAIVRRPKLFLMDEPLSNLDAKLRARTRLELARLHRRLGATTVYVTHDQVEALTMGDRIAVLDEGTLRQLATPEELYEYPADLVVAEFVGAPPMNLITADASVHEGRLNLQAGDFCIDLAVTDLQPRVAAGLTSLPKRVVVGVRPEYIRLLSPEDETAAARGTVERVELLGSERVVWIELGASKDRLWAARVPTEARFAEGSTAAFTVVPIGLRLFTPAGQALGASAAGHSARESP